MGGIPGNRRRVAIALCIGAIAWAGVEVFPHAKDLVVIPKWGKVSDGLYRSGRLSSLWTRSTLKEHGIGRVLSLTGRTAADEEMAEELEICGALKIEHVSCPMPGDGVAPVESYVEAIAQIHEARARGENVLVHCSAGSQRTGAVVALYRLLVLGHPAREVREELLAYGHDPRRNPGLIPHLERNMPQIAEGLVRRGIIKRAPEMKGLGAD